MNKIYFILLLSLAGTISACNLTQHNHTAEIAKMEDTLFKAFPTLNRVSIEVKGDFGTEIQMTFGDRELYDGTDEERQKVTKEVTAITQHVFGEKTPDKGSLIFVAEENTITVDDANKKVYSMILEQQK